jgi:hypothetical protein
MPANNSEFYRNICIMKKFLLFFVALFSSSLLMAQAVNPVKWTAIYQPTNDKEGVIIVTGVIEKGWHTYSQRKTDAGPVPSSFIFEKNKNYELVGETKESDAHEEFVKAFEANVFVFTDKAEFKQKVKLKGKAGFQINFKLEYMCCNDLMCLPPKTIDLMVVTKK